MSPDTENPTEVPAVGGAPDRAKVNLDRLDYQRRLRGWTKAELAKRMGVTSETVSEIYRWGEAAPGTFGKLKATLEANPPSEMAIELMADPEPEAASA